MDSNSIMSKPSIEIIGKSIYNNELLTGPCLEFLSMLHRLFNPIRHQLLEARVQRQKLIDNGTFPSFLPETAHIRNGHWHIGTIPANLQDRRVEITGPVDRKMLINGLNSGARVFMADFEDANAPSWKNVIEGQKNLVLAINKKIDFLTENGKRYTLNDEVAVLKIRPRGWHLNERHLLIEGEEISASIFDFGVYLFHNAKTLIENNTGPYFYLPKLESHHEARLWNDVFIEAQNLLNIPVGTIKATVLIETILAAFEMEEIIFELKEHITGLNAGRWDYIFSIIKKFRNHNAFLLPDRAQITMNVPFMRSYAQLLVKTCHKRGIHAIGGMSAFIPNRNDEEINTIAIEKVKADKELEVQNGFDGTWVAHPDLVSIAKDIFDKALGTNQNQKTTLHENLQIIDKQLVDVQVPQGVISEDGLRVNINVGIRYIESWLRGIGAAAIDNLMEDAATAEISRAQVWQWIRHRVVLADGRVVDTDLVDLLITQEITEIRHELGEDIYNNGKFVLAESLFRDLTLSTDFSDFLTIKAYNFL